MGILIVNTFPKFPKQTKGGQSPKVARSKVSAGSLKDPPPPSGKQWTNRMNGMDQKTRTKVTYGSTDIQYREVTRQRDVTEALMGPNTRSIEGGGAGPKKPCKPATATQPPRMTASPKDRSKCTNNAGFAKSQQMTLKTLWGGGG